MVRRGLNHHRKILYLVHEEDGALEGILGRAAKCEWDGIGLYIVCIQFSRNMRSWIHEQESEFSSDHDAFSVHNLRGHNTRSLQRLVRRLFDIGKLCVGKLEKKLYPTRSNSIGKWRISRKNCYFLQNIIGNNNFPYTSIHFQFYIFV